MRLTSRQTAITYARWPDSLEYTIVYSLTGDNSMIKANNGKHQRGLH